MSSGNRSRQFLRYNAGDWENLGKKVIVETPVSLTVNGEVLITLMCTPTDLEALAVGFLFNEGIVKSKQEIELIQVCAQGDNVDVWLKHPIDHPKQWRRTSGCTGGSISHNPGKSTTGIIEWFYDCTPAINQLVEALERSPGILPGSRWCAYIDPE